MNLQSAIDSIGYAYIQGDISGLNQTLTSIRHRYTLKDIEAAAETTGFLWRDVLCYANKENAPALWLEYYWVYADRTDLLNAFQGAEIDYLRMMASMDAILPLENRVRSSTWFSDGDLAVTITHTLRILWSQSLSKEESFYL